MSRSKWTDTFHWSINCQVKVFFNFWMLIFNSKARMKSRHQHYYVYHNCISFCSQPFSEQQIFCRVVAYETVKHGFHFESRRQFVGAKFRGALRRTARIVGPTAQQRLGQRKTNRTMHTSDEKVTEPTVLHTSTGKVFIQSGTMELHEKSGEPVGKQNFTLYHQWLTLKHIVCVAVSFNRTYQYFQPTVMVWCTVLSCYCFADWRQLPPDSERGRGSHRFLTGAKLVLTLIHILYGC